MKSFAILALILFVVSLVSADCGSSVEKEGYHLASKALAKNIGMKGGAACMYSELQNNTWMDHDCPTSCQVLIQAVWHAPLCHFCEDPGYTPNIGDPWIKRLSMDDIFQVWGGNKTINGVLLRHVFCRDWLNEPTQLSQWQCSN
eukprot:TRINITY_DN64976_c0_g1_i1.p1 TRINITY_DN64976_c0_g1~~TRINITY_DN64976_c0_g1_i1.p1  ORF type:complete len:144 (+),score=13.28 TRINITY_DN64976_c0_g1_i1:22-453(+)